jgi:hypothetical protein
MLDIRWGQPYKVYSGPIVQWRREWCIPSDYLNGFFTFWKKHKFKMLADGFTITKSKANNRWYLFETRDTIGKFNSFGTQETEVPYVEPHPGFILPEYHIKDTKGLRPWQVEAADRLVASIQSWGAAVDGSDTGCHAKGQLILMADGRLKKVEDIVVGDIVMGWKGPQSVTELKRGRQQMAKIVPIKGDPFIVNMDHILTVVLTNGCSPSHKKTNGYLYGSIVDIKVKDYIQLPKVTKHAMKLFSAGVNSWSDADIPFSPYFVGALLGDGGMSSKSMVTFTSEKNVIWDAISEECDAHGWKLGDTNKLITQRITHAPSLFKWLRENNLLPVSCENKHIPFNYKTGSIEQRLQILAGLIDTDGHYSNSKGYDITLKSKQLSDDIVFLARSLGLSAYMKPCQKKCSNGVVGNYFRTYISGNINVIPCRVNYKQANFRKQRKDALRKGFKVEMLLEDDYFGFSLDGDGRFLLGDFTVTHNTGKTYTACAVAREMGYDILVVCPKAVIKSWNKVVCNHFKMKDKLVGVVNYEKLRNGRTDSEIASFVLKRHTKRSIFKWKISPKRTLIIWDESQKMKNWSTQNAKVCKTAIKEGFPMLFLSATVATNPLELRVVGLALKIFKSDNKSYWDWARSHGVYQGQWGMEFNNNPLSLRRLHHTIFEQSGVRLRRDVIPGFPECEIIPEVYNIDDKDAQQINSIYEEMERELEVVARREKADKERADNKKQQQSELIIQLRARQKIELIKVPLMVEMVEEALQEGFSIVVFINFVETMDALSERLKTKCIFDGRTSDKIRDQNVENFQDDKERVVLINMQSGGAGLNLHDLNGKFPRMSIISPSYSAIFMRQALGRIWRDDAKTKAIQKIVCIANTVEENVCRNCQQKLNNLDMLNDGDLSLSRQYEKI